VAVPSAVKRVYVREGERVKNGQRLILFEELGSLHSPFPGVVSSLSVREGELANPNQNLIHVLNYDELYFVIRLDQESAIQIQKGQKIRLRFENLSMARFEAEVARVFPQKDTFVVHTHPIRLPKVVLPGMTADVAIEVTDPREALVLPLMAVEDRSIWIRRGDQTEKVDVELGAIEDTWVEVLKPKLKTTDLILIKEAL
jgi:multidrug efflux pump subunit AcrA (membrane-fusion protein)